MDAGNGEVLAEVSDFVHLGGVGEHAGFAVALHRVILPGTLPELVKHLEVFVGHVVAVVVLELIVVAHVAGGGGQVAGDDVPADAAVGEVVEGRHAPREGVRVLVAGAGRDAESEVVGDGGHRRNEQHRVVHRNLGAMTDRGLVAATVDVVGAEHVGDEDAIEVAAFEELRQLRPVAQVLVAPGLIIGVTPHSG